ncbi:OmpA family protein [Flexibacterium corallicola]|uniref:OmpA family protein n=1 Tax=Flexibacterium corallicola TaxID=3037259 RepID=UPI00286EE80C|nr:OmpA family protein [Pseudovibrio sp. M1P-2-3]
MAYSKKMPLALLFILSTIVSGLSISPALSACPPGFPKGLPCPQEAWETVGLEHADRRERLLRLTDAGLNLQFFEETITKEMHGLSDFPTDIPVLRVVAQHDVFFDRGSSQVKPEAYPILDIIAQSLQKEPPDVSVFIVGHTDSDGPDEYNKQLGLDRAKTVSDMLARRGVYQANIFRISFGESLPIATNATIKGKARNRRVEFLFAAQTQAIVASFGKQMVNICSDPNQAQQRLCQKSKVSLDAEKVFVTSNYNKNINSLNRKTQTVMDNKELSSSQLNHTISNIELQRKKIPIEISRQKIVIQLDR